MTIPYLSCIIRTCWSRRALLDNVIRLLHDYVGRDAVPVLEVILALDTSEIDKWVMFPSGNYIKRTFTAAVANEPTWARLHRKLLDGFAAASGTWVVVMDDDDWFSPDRLRQLTMTDAQVISHRQVYVHELTSTRRGTYLRTMHAPGLLENTLSFRRGLLGLYPITQPEMGLWVNALPAGVKHQFIDCDHVMFLHGRNADLAAGRDGFKVGDDGTVFDGPAEYHSIGACEPALRVVGAPEMRFWEHATR